MHFDGINNTGNGHSNTATTWKDLSGKTNNGTLNGCKWGENCLEFDGIDDWVNCGEKNYSNITIEAVVEYNEIPNNEIGVAVNWETGGYGLSLNSENSLANGCSMYVNNDYRLLASNKKTTINKIYSINCKYDGREINFGENGETHKINIIGNIGKTQSSTVFVLGANPSGNSVRDSFLNGKIYSIRLYNRALTESEVNNNYEIDKVRFGIK